MTKKTKRVLFYSAVAVFLLLSYAVVLYAEGYKFSFSEAKFVRTGSIYIKANESAKVYMNDKFLDNTSFFSNSYSLRGLLPGQYTVRLTKDDYSSWQKRVTVEEGLVNEFPSAMLLPLTGPDKDNLKKELQLLLYPVVKNTRKLFYIKNRALYRTTDQAPEKLADNVIGFALSDDGNKLAWWNSNELWVMWLYDTNYQPFKKAGDKDLLTRFSSRIKSAVWFRDSDHIAVDTNGFKVIEIDKRGGINIAEIN